MKSILFRITRFDSTVPPSQMEYSWDEMGGTLGRGVSNDWVLSDEKRHLSGRHAIVKFQNGSFYITDKSTNGLFVNGSPVPLGKDNTARLKGGDILKLGGYVVEVVASTEDVIPLPKQEVVAPESAKSKRPRPGGRRARQENPFDTFPAFDDDPVPPAVPDKSSLADWEDKPKQTEETSDDLLFPTDWADKPVQVKEGNDDQFFIDGDFIIPGSEQSTPYQDSKQNHSASKGTSLGLSDYLIPPDIPDEASQNKELTESFDLSASAGAENTEKEDDLRLPDSFLSGSEESDYDPFDFSGIEEKAPESVVSVQEVKAVDVSDETHVSPPLEKPIQKESVREASAFVDASTSDTNSKDFLRGLGIENEQANQEIAGHLDMEKVGILFRTLLQGSMDVLRTRTEIKSEMRMDVTTIQPIQNNPVKFSIDVEDALVRLLVPQKQAFMPAEQAIVETYDDIKAHQVAVIAGVQASLKHVLGRFEPEKLVERLQKRNSIIANIPIQRQAMLWSLFEELYSTIEEEAQDDFQRLFGLEFARAYEELIAQLESARSIK